MKKQMTPIEIEAKKAKLKALFEQLAKMNAVDRANLASKSPIVTCCGHALSIPNMCLVALQFPHATVVGGFRQWIEKGRCVKKGERGSVIRVPGKQRVETTEASETDEHGIFFLTGIVFDIVQTEELKSDVPAYSYNAEMAATA